MQSSQSNRMKLHSHHGQTEWKSLLEWTFNIRVRVKRHSHHGQTEWKSLLEWTFNIRVRVKRHSHHRQTEWKSLLEWTFNIRVRVKRHSQKEAQHWQWNKCRQSQGEHTAHTPLQHHNKTKWGVTLRQMELNITVKQSGIPQSCRMKHHSHGETPQSNRVVQGSQTEIRGNSPLEQSC